MKSNFKETFFSFISHLPIAAFVADSHGRILASNQLWLETTGFLEDEIHSLEQLDDLLSQKITPIWKKIFHSRQPANRSEERRVEKECRTRRSEQEYKET